LRDSFVMKSHAPAGKRTADSSRHSSAGEGGLAIEPPRYGIDFVDSRRPATAPVQRQGGVKPALRAKGARAPNDVVQLVKAYRVEYQHNRKVEMDEKKNVTLTAPIDISFVLPDHSEYFASERSPDQLAGLRRMSWEMDDDWWSAVTYKTKKGRQPTGKAAGMLKTMDKLAEPSWSDGASLVKFIKQTALHFKEHWSDSLNDAVLKGSGSEEDLEAEILAGERDFVKATDLVWAWYEDNPAEGMEVAYGEREDQQFPADDEHWATLAEAKKNGWR
jgi:hypothetical protein